MAEGKSRKSNQRPIACPYSSFSTILFLGFPEDRFNILYYRNLRVSYIYTDVIFRVRGMN